MLAQNVAEKLVVVGQVGGQVEVLLVAKQQLEGLPVSFQQAHFEFVAIMGILGDKVAVLDLLAKVRIAGRDFVLCKEIAQRQKQQTDRSQPLLAVDDVVFDLAAIALHRADDAAKKVAGAVAADHLFQVLIELATIFCFPVILALVDGDYKVIFASLHQFQQVGF